MDGAEFSGMTLNERLHQAGLLAEFDRAVAAKDFEKVVDVLKQVGVGPAEAGRSAEHVIASRG